MNKLLPKDEKVLIIASLLPPQPYSTGPPSSPFSVLEDALLICVTNMTGKRELCPELKGNPVTPLFWEKVVESITIERRAEELRLR